MFDKVEYKADCISSTGWAALAVENAGCSTSTRQSPIDVTNTTTQEVAPGTLKMNFPTVASAEFENIGTTLEVVMEGKNASTTVNGKVYVPNSYYSNNWTDASLQLRTEAVPHPHPKRAYSQWSILPSRDAYGARSIR